MDRRETISEASKACFKEACYKILEGLSCMGFELDEDNFKETPDRFAKAYFEIFEGCMDTEAQKHEILSKSFPADGCQDIVTAKDIVVFSMCPHHILPVEYHVCVGYIPPSDGRVFGISKLTRLVKLLAKRPTLQEKFTRDIVEALMDEGADGAICIVEGQHMCMRMRGAQSRESTITTTAVEGIFAKDSGAKLEFMDTIRDRLKFK